MKFNNILYSLTLSLWVASSFAQVTVYLESGEFGRGILKPRNNECFAIAPLHVVEETEGLPFELIGEGGINSNAILAKAYAGDVALVRIQSGGTQHCKDFNLTYNYQAYLETLTDGVLELRNSDGSTDKILVDIINIDEQNITIKSKDPSKPFAKGMSGGSLFSYGAERAFLGLLLNIDEEENRIGYVFQADDIDRILSDFFGAGKITYSTQSQKKDDAPLTSDELKVRIIAARAKVAEDVIYTQELFSEIRNEGRFRATNELKLSLQRSQIYYSNLSQSLRIDDSGLVKLLNEISKKFDDAYKTSVSNKITFEQDLLAQITMLNYQLADLQFKL